MDGSGAKRSLAGTGGLLLAAMGAGVLAPACGEGGGPGDETLLPIAQFATVAVDTVGEVGFYLSFTEDRSGGLHLSYGDRTNGSLKYASCAAACGMPSAWTKTAVDTGLGGWGYYWNTTIAVDGTGRRHIGYFDLSTATRQVNQIKYATCIGTCTSAAAWQIGVVDTSGTNPVIAVHQSGRVHGAWFDRGAGSVVYATCLAACATPSNWQRVTIDTTTVPFWLAVTLDASARPHITYSTTFSARMRYGTCVSTCLQTAHWSLTDLPWDGDSFVESMGLDVDRSGGIHVGYNDWGARTRYLYCPGLCNSSASWQTTPVDTTFRRSGWGTVATPLGRPRVSYYDLNTGDLLVGYCDTSPCLGQGAWHSVLVDSMGNVGAYSVPLLDAFGRPTIAYLDWGKSDLRVAIPF